jgi:hypothetical protein
MLGDAVAQKLANAHGGTLERGDSPGGGSLVELCLPLKHAANASTSLIQLPAGGAAAPADELRTTGR